MAEQWGLGGYFYYILVVSQPKQQQIQYPTLQGKLDAALLQVIFVLNFTGAS